MAEGDDVASLDKLEMGEVEVTVDFVVTDELEAEKESGSSLSNFSHSTVRTESNDDTVVCIVHTIEDYIPKNLSRSYCKTFAGGCTCS